jgi:hypothetical protein
MDNIRLLPPTNTSEERIQARIESFRKELLEGESNIEQVGEMIGIILEYLSNFEDDPYLNQAFVKLNESNFWLYSFIDS